MSADYEAEQRELKDRAAALQGELDKAQEATVNAEKFMSVVRKCLSIEELTHTLLRDPRVANRAGRGNLPAPA